jgi:uncharacterized protein YndB with AHSA1/START domain
VAIEVDFDVPIEVAFDYLLEPSNRAEWQSSLRRIEDRDPGEPRTGMRWTDVTGPGLRPAMEISGMERPRSWTERGTWRGIAAELTLFYTQTPTGCRVRAEFAIAGTGAFRPFGPMLTLAGRSAVGPDLKRAARLLSERASDK